MEYICKDPKATVRAANVLATLEAFQLQPHLVEQLLPVHGLERAKLQGDQRVPVQSWLNLLRDIAERVGPSKVRHVGIKIIETALFPPALDSVETVLLALNDIYKMNHTGEVGRYTCSRVEGGSIRIECATPYPREFERGLIEGITRNESLAKGARFAHIFDDGPIRHGEVTCILTVRRLSA